MTATTFGGHPIVVGGPHQGGGSVYDARLTNALDTNLDATLESIVYYGYVITSDRGSHTIDTTGSSSLGCMVGNAMVFSNVGTELRIGLAAMDLTNGPPGRAVNVTDAITFDVYKSMLGNSGHGMAANTWYESVPNNGTKTIANGDFVAFAMQLVTRAGTDLLPFRYGANASAPNSPGITSFLSSVYAAGGGSPNCFITFSDGAFGYFIGGYVFNSVSATTTWNSGSATKEYGNLFQSPVPMEIIGVQIAGCDPDAAFDVVLYSDPLGTPSAQKTLAVDHNAVATGTVGRNFNVMFPASYSLAANTPIGVVLKPGGSNISAVYKSLFSTNHRITQNLGSGCYAISRASGAFAAVNSGKDCYNISLLCDSFSDGAGGSGGPVGSNMRGGMTN